VCVCVDKKHLFALTSFGLYEHDGTCLEIFNPSERVLSCLHLFQPVWTCLDVYVPVRTCLAVFGRAWTYMDMFGRV
jgi:hypothetical protein